MKLGPDLRRLDSISIDQDMPRIGRLKVPSYEEWRAEEARVDAQRIAEGKDLY
jgi:hypothetical protein